ncbi:MAG: hypothetical protein CMH56_13375 [Myxococcales bacterium]|nr:hypothetical protein [Myxococcales bacterium]
MPLLAVGPLGCPEDATPVDEGGKKSDDDDDDDDDDEEEESLVAAGGVCQTNPTVDFSVGNCQEGLICVPGLNAGWGTCRVDCSTLNAEGQMDEDPEVCTGGETCQTILPSTYNKLTGQITEGMFALVCMPQTTNVSSPCYGIYDEDSCSEDRSCQIAGTERVSNADGSFQDMIFTDLRCRDACDLEGVDETWEDPFGNELPNKTCSGDEVCLWNQDPLAGSSVVWAADPPSSGAWTEGVCTEDEDCDEGYQCIDTTDDLAHCGYFDRTGWCGTPVDLITSTQWEAAQGSGLPEEVICDEVDATLLCDDRAFRDTDVDAELYCIGISSSSNQGICMAFCNIPADPGDLEDDGFSGACPANHECSADLGVALIFGPWTDENGFVDDRDSAKTCDPVECPEGLECEACIHPGAQCGSYTLNQAGDVFSGCFMPYSFCQEIVEDDPVVDTDGGVVVEEPATDAGTADDTTDTADAGMADDTTEAADAGTTDTGDTNATADAGSSDDGSDDTAADAGSTDTGDTNATADAGSSDDGSDDTATDAGSSDDGSDDTTADAGADDTPAVIDLTLNLDTNCAGFDTVTSVRLSGPWWSWDPNNGPLATDDDGDGIYTVVIPNMTADMEYLWYVNGTQESLLGVSTESCVGNTDNASYANRVYVLGSGDRNETFGQCQACD